MGNVTKKVSASSATSSAAASAAASKEIFGFSNQSLPCTDQKCPYHGQLQVQPGLIRGKVVKKDINRSATIEWYNSQYVPKYERYEVRRSRIRVHNPACLDAKIGDNVVVARTRPLSKTKHHVIIQKVTHESA